jgi:hypothetical protein
VSRPPDRPVRSSAEGRAVVPKRADPGVVAQRPACAGLRPELPRKSILQSYGKAIAGVVAGILVLAAIGFVVLGGGIPGGEKGNSSASGLLGALPLEGVFGGGSGNSTAPGLLGALPLGGAQDEASALNQGVPVVTDTALNPK